MGKPQDFLSKVPNFKGLSPNPGPQAEIPVHAEGQGQREARPSRRSAPSSARIRHLGKHHVSAERPGSGHSGCMTGHMGHSARRGPWAVPPSREREHSTQADHTQCPLGATAKPQQPSPSGPKAWSPPHTRCPQASACCQGLSLPCRGLACRMSPISRWVRLRKFWAQCWHSPESLSNESINQAVVPYFCPETTSRGMVLATYFKSQ